MGGAAGLLVVCTVLRVLAPVTGAAEVVDHSTNAAYWRCKNWPEALKREPIKYWSLSEPLDDDTFVWFCPDRCKSMPYMDIKLTFEYWKRTSCDGVCGGEWHRPYPNNQPITDWKGNRDYRAPFTSELQSDAVPWPESQVSAVSKCRFNRNKENLAHQETQCWPEMKHLGTLFANPLYVNGVYEANAPLEACQTGATAVEVNVMACFRTETENIFVTPAYIFWPGSTPMATSPTQECRVSRVIGLQPSSTIAQYWSTPQTYQNHSLDWKSFKSTVWRDLSGNPMDVTGWVDEKKSLLFGDINTKHENWKFYEWQCSSEYWDLLKNSWLLRWDYFEARHYESQCKTVPCGHFRTQSCWQNAYSFAASPCAWRNKMLLLEKAGIPVNGYVSLADVTTAEFAASMHAYGNGVYTLQFDRRTMDASKHRSLGNLAATETTLSLAQGERFKISLKPEFSCVRCDEQDQVRGLDSVDSTKKEGEVAKCIVCLQFERLVGYRCVACDVHTARASNSRSSCSVCPAEAPMRKAVSSNVAGDANCTACALLDYFKVGDATGCLRLGSVMDGLWNGQVRGVDKVFLGSMLRDVQLKAYRALAPRMDWWRAVSEVMCASTAEAVGGAVQLSYRRWCGHREIVREGQALLQVGNASEYSLLRTQDTTAGYAAISDVCRAGTLRPTTGGLFDLQCTHNRSNAVLDISVVRKGGAEKCAVCAGAFYTKACLPTYHPALVNEEAAYFASGEGLSSAGTCQACNRQCLAANHYMSPESLSCMWNGSAQERVTGVVSALASAGLFYWYKQAPCKPCVDATLSTTDAVQTKQCGNKRTYRTWDALQSTLVSKEARSIPMTQTCCSKSRDGTVCTPSENAVDLDAWIGTNCKEASELEDMERVQTTYCPPGWYVDEACARVTPDKWVPDCCKRCEACGPGRFKTETYAACSGATFIDTEQNGCETSCLSNSYRKDGRCFRCEQCSTTGTGEHG